MHICARNSHSTGQSSSPALVAPWCVQHACNSKQSNSLSDSLCLLGHALRTIIRSKVHHCLKALSSLATVAVDSSKRAAKEHVSVAGQVLAACEAIEQCPKTMAAAAADRLTSQLSQLEDVSGEFAEAIAESQRLLSSEDVEAAIEKAMTQGIPIWDEDEEAMLPPLTALLKVAVKVVGKTRQYIANCSASLFQQHESRVLELATSIAQSCDNVVLGSYTPDEIDTLRSSSTALKAHLEALLDIVIALRSASKSDAVEDVTDKVAEASVNKTSSAATTTAATTAAAAAATTATTAATTGPPPTGDIPPSLTSSKDWPSFLKQVATHNVVKLAKVLDQLEEAA
eukprot:m.18901 g.18901  ORF g.18901 m.18901 type:complete len:342 (-) comp10859_c0_seq8:75-1100(-)